MISALLLVIANSLYNSTYIQPSASTNGLLGLVLRFFYNRHKALRVKPQIHGSGESLATDRFLDESITVGKEYQVRAIGQERYAKFIGRLKRIRPGYGWALTFEDVKYISSDSSLAPVTDRALATVFPREASFTIYSDSPPSGYGLQDLSFQPARTQIFYGGEYGRQRV